MFIRFSWFVFAIQKTTHPPPETRYHAVIIIIKMIRNVVSSFVSASKTTDMHCFHGNGNKDKDNILHSLIWILFTLVLHISTTCPAIHSISTIIKPLTQYLHVTPNKSNKNFRRHLPKTNTQRTLDCCVQPPQCNYFRVIAQRGRER